MKSKWLALIGGAILLMTAAGCAPIPPAGQAAPSQVATATVPPAEEEPVKEIPVPTPAHPADLQPLVQEAIENLAQRLGIAPEQVAVVEAVAVIWPDAAIGCPQPDMMYIQVPQDGALIRLSASGRLYNYHYGGRRGLFLCEQPGKPGATPAPEEMQLPGGGGEDL